MFDHRWMLVALAGLLPAVAPAGTADSSGLSDLAPVAGSSQPDAVGTVALSATARGCRFEVEVRRVEPCTTLALFVDDGTGTMLEAGVLSPGRTDRRLSFDTARGESLPAGASSAADLAGRFVEIRDPEGAAILVGSVPPPAARERPSCPC